MEVVCKRDMYGLLRLTLGKCISDNGDPQTTIGVILASIAAFVIRRYVDLDM